MLNKSFNCTDKKLQGGKIQLESLHSPSKTYKYLFGLKLSKTSIFQNQIENGVIFFTKKGIVFESGRVWYSKQFLAVDNLVEAQDIL